MRPSCGTALHEDDISEGWDVWTVEDWLRFSLGLEDSWGGSHGAQDGAIFKDESLGMILQVQWLADEVVDDCQKIALMPFDDFLNQLELKWSHKN